MYLFLMTFTVHFYLYQSEVGTYTYNSYYFGYCFCNYNVKYSTNLRYGSVFKLNIVYVVYT